MGLYEGSIFWILPGFADKASGSSRVLGFLGLGFLCLG